MPLSTGTAPITGADIEIAYAYLAGKQARYDVLWDYYDGRHPLIYNASKLQDVFKGLDATFNENWSAVVVNAVLDRIAIERFQIGDGTAADEALADVMLNLWRQTGLDLDAYDAHLCALVTGEAFICCGESATGSPVAYYNDSRLVTMVYDDANPHIARFAGKWWEEATPVGRGVVTRLTLYYPDRFEYYAANQPRNQLSTGRAFVLQDTAANPYGEIPIYHLRREQRAIISEMADIVTPQAQLNKLLGDMMIAAEFGAYKQRWVISQAATEGKLKNSPSGIWHLVAGDGEGQGTAAGEFTATELSNYLVAIERSAGVIATIAGVPKVLLFSQGDVPSGASLRALEAPLVRKAERYAGRWEVTWRKVLRFLLRKGAGQDVPETEIDVVWTEPATTQPETDALTVKTLVEAGVPLRTALRRQGWTDTELDQLEQDEADAQASSANLAAGYLAQAEANASRQAAEAPPVAQNGAGVAANAQ